MLNSRIRRGFHSSILVLLTLGLTVGIFSPSTKILAGPSGWIGTLPDNNWTDLNLGEIAPATGAQLPNEPIFLRYLTQLLGNDWLGADWLYIGLADYRYPAFDINGQQLYVTNPVTGAKTPQWNYARFWTEPGPALLKIGDTLWVWGYDAGTHKVFADSILVNPPTRVAQPDDVGAYGRILSVSAQTITVQNSEGIRSTVTVDQYTTYSFPSGEGLSRPQDGLWLSIAWLTGFAGLLGRYEGFHGTYRGILRLDFSQP
ncbi:MAG: hypothetical protein WAM09_04370 [Anaerolineales bacterium]